MRLRREHAGASANERRSRADLVQGDEMFPISAKVKVMEWPGEAAAAALQVKHPPR